MQIFVVVVGGLAHVGGQRARHAVAKQDAKKRAHQRRRHLFADLFRRAAERAHGDHHAQHGRHNAQARQRIRHRVSAPTGCDRVVVMHFHIEFHHLVHVEWFNAAGDGRAQRVAHKVAA